MQGMASVTEKVSKLVLRARKAGLPRDKLAKNMGYAGGSSIQRYEDAERYTKKYLIPELAEKYAKALAGLGDPRITYEEVIALAGRESEQGTVSPRDRQLHVELALNGSDQYMARVLEDVIELLVNKKVLKPGDLNDLSPPARELLEYRRQLRENSCR